MLVRDVMYAVYYMRYIFAGESLGGVREVRACVKTPVGLAEPGA